MGFLTKTNKTAAKNAVDKAQNDGMKRTVQTFQNNAKANSNASNVKMMKTLRTRNSNCGAGGSCKTNNSATK